VSGLLRMEQLPAFQAETYACAARLGRISASAREPGYGHHALCSHVLELNSA